MPPVYKLHLFITPGDVMYGNINNLSISSTCVQAPFMTGPKGGCYRQVWLYIYIYISCETGHTKVLCSTSYRGPIVATLTNKFGCRRVCIAGSILTCTAQMLSTLSTDIYVLIVTYGFLTGRQYIFVKLFSGPMGFWNQQHSGCI